MSAVSYTHLDVYKRQDLEMMFAPPLRLLALVFLLLPALAHADGRTIIVLDGSGSVSYTHLHLAPKMERGLFLRTRFHSSFAA